ncbi:MAG: hypothetical protein JW927_12600 [Deltaproteobacteria bacterium]|nr:hypothetical protein [Deltaproteobacteria bacterium]
MIKKVSIALSLLSILSLSITGNALADDQPIEINAQPPMYSYIAVWNIPESEWENRKDQAAEAKKILDQAIDNNTIFSYGYDRNPLHDTFWLAKSKDGLETVRDQFEKIGITQVPAKEGAPVMPVSILVSRYYNCITIRCENAYVHVGIYKIRPDAPADAVDQLSKYFFGPVLEKMLVGGTIFEWETDVYDNPKDSPGTFLIAYLSEKAEDLEKANNAIQERLKTPLPNGPALGSLIDMKAITDVVVRSYAVYKK